MSSAISFSGFNNIDFGLILTSVMELERRPLVSLQDRQSALQSRLTTFGSLSSQVSTLQRAARALSSAETLTSYAATSSDTSAVAVSAGAAAAPGRYDIVVNQLARAQVTASATSAPDADTTPIATGGSITIGSETIQVNSPMTLRQLADAINARSDAPARAAVVQSAPGTYRLVLTAKATGDANGFTVGNALTGGSGIGFTDTDGDGTSGDSTADNAVQAANASLLVNNIAVTSASNTLDSVVPGATVTLLRQDPTASVVVDVAADPEALKTKVQAFITAYNSLVRFAADQGAAAAQGNDASIGRDPVLRELRNSLRGTLTSAYGSGGSAGYLSRAGIEFTRTGTLELNEAVFDRAVTDGSVNVPALFAGENGQPGAFAAVVTSLNGLTQAGGGLANATSAINAQVSRLTSQIADMEDRLAVRRAALQREFTAADEAMSRLKQQSGSLASFGASL